MSLKGYPKSICLHVPHSGTVIPKAMRDAFTVGDGRLKEELLRMTDWYTDELFCSDRYPSAVFNFSRLVCDVERFLDPADEINTAIGMGMYYTHGYDRSRIKETPFADDKGLSLYSYCLNLYDKHHQALREMVDEILWCFGEMVLVDCHSFPSVALPYEGEMAKDIPRPDICIGTDEVFTPDWLVKLAKDYFVKAGLTVALNTPFSGCLVPQPYYADKDRRVQGIMIEVNRKLYMDEETGEKNEGFYLLRNIIRGFYDALRLEKTVMVTKERCFC